MRLAPLLLASVLMACGGGAAQTTLTGLDDELASLDSGRPALQYYVVLTANPQAMQAKADIDAMWRAVDGQGARYQAVRRHVKWVPGEYRLDITTDFAALPHPQVSHAQLVAMTKGLPAEIQAKAKAAQLAVFLRSDTATLPGGNHIRLAGLAALYAADAYDGMLIDLIARRAWTPDAWQAELSGARLTARQARLARRADAEGTKWLYTRGNPKWGRPDVQMRGVRPGTMQAAQARFTAVNTAVLQNGGRPGMTLKTAAGPLRLQPCTAPKRFHDAGCVQISAP